MSGTFAPVYSDEQRAAIFAAYQPGVVGAKRVVELAAAGELRGPTGKRLKPFETGENTVRDIRRVELLRKGTAAPRGTAEAEGTADALGLRARLLAVADAMLTDFEREAKRSPATADPERLSKIVKAYREAEGLASRQPSALAVDDDDPPLGLGDQILAAHRASPNGTGTSGVQAPDLPDDSAQPEVPSEGLADGLPGSLVHQLAVAETSEPTSPRPPDPWREPFEPGPAPPTPRRR